jgi:hypothetical protein
MMTYQSTPPIARSSPARRSRTPWIILGVVILLGLLVGIPTFVAYALIQGPGHQMIRNVEEMIDAKPLSPAYYWLAGDWSAANGDNFTIGKDSTISYRFGASSGKTSLFIRPDQKGARVADLLGDFDLEFRVGPKKGSPPILAIKGQEFHRVSK